MTNQELPSPEAVDQAPDPDDTPSIVDPIWAPVCDAVSPPSLDADPGEPVVVTCTLPAGHEGRWHQHTSPQGSCVAWLGLPDTRDLLLGQAARIMAVALVSRGLDDTGMRVWLTMFRDSGLTDPRLSHASQPGTADTI